MKTINLPALSQISLEEIGGFLSWLENQHTGSTTLVQMQKTPPIRSNKINPIIKTLEQFGFVAQKQGRIEIHARGKDYLRSEISVRRAVIRTLFSQIDWVQKIMTSLSASPSGRIHRGTINDSYNSTFRIPISESEVLAFTSWAQSCELFGYDKKKEELIHMESLVPHDPRPVSPNLPLAS